MVDAAVLEKLEAGFAKLAASDSKSLLKKYLTKEVFDNLKTKKTPSFGSTLLDVIQSGKLTAIFIRMYRGRKYLSGPLTCETLSAQTCG
jgi:hypothetical protein